LPRPIRAPVPRDQLVDCACIALCVVLLAAPFLGSLGFYSDDWWILHQFKNAFEQGRFGLQTIINGFEGRPLQGAYLAGLFWAFRFDPLGYHLVNAAVRAVAAVCLYRLFRRMRIETAIALAAVAIFVVLPQCSTGRVWYSTFQIPLSLLFALLSLHAQLSFAKYGGKWRVGAAALLALLSIAAYEVFAPLTVAFPLWLIVEARREGRLHGSEGRRHAWLAVAAVVTVGLAVLAKYAATDRAQAPSLEMYMKGLKRLVEPDYDWRTEGSLNIFATIEVNLWQPLVGLARGTAAVIRGDLPTASILAAIAVAALIFWRLVATKKNEDDASRSGLRAMVIGSVAFLLAHAVFLINSQMQFSTTGIGNRALVGMAPGLALAAAGLLALLFRRLPRIGLVLFSAAVSLVVLTAAWRMGQIYNYWAESWSIEQRILASARTDLEALPDNSTVIFDGVCPYHGPGIVMEAWEAADMLSLTLGREVWADTSTNRMQLRRDGLATTIFNATKVYPYGPNLYAYDPYRHLLTPLVDFRAASGYFSNRNGVRKCPTGYVGQGVLI